MFIGFGFGDLFYDLRLNSAVAVFSIFSTQMLGESMSRKNDRFPNVLFNRIWNGRNVYVSMTFPFGGTS